MTPARSLRLALALPLVALWGLAACSNETRAQKYLRLCNSWRSCPGHNGSACSDEATIQQTLIAPHEAAGCGSQLDAYLNCALANSCASFGFGATACKSEDTARSTCLVAKTCGNGTCDTGEDALNCSADCASS